MAFLSVVAIGAMLSTGCTTVTRTAADGSVTTNSVPDAIVLQVAAENAAAIGGAYVLQTHPEFRPQLELTLTSLRTLVAAGTGSVADLHNALSQLPVTALQGTNGTIVVSGAVVLIDAARNELARFDKNGIWSYYVQPVATGLRDGLAQALGTRP